MAEVSRETPDHDMKIKSWPVPHGIGGTAVLVVDQRDPIFKTLTIGWPSREQYEKSAAMIKKKYRGWSGDVEYGAFEDDGKYGVTAGVFTVTPIDLPDRLALDIERQEPRG